MARVIAIDERHDMQPTTIEWPIGWLQRRQTFAAFVCAVLFLWTVQYRSHISIFYWDSVFYWNLADPINFQAHTTTVRGYVFPLLLYIIRQFTELAANPVSAYCAVACVIYAAVLTALVPKWFVSMFGGELSFGRRLVPVALLGIIFPGLILYPLSDLPALLLAWGGLYSVYRASVAKRSGTKTFICWLVIAGFLSGAAYNVRTIYIFVVPLIVLLAALMLARARLLSVSATFLGLVLVSAPQAIFNLETNKELNPGVAFSIGNNSLFVVHLMSGMTIQRYETTFSGGISYRDPAGERLARKLREHYQLGSHEEYWSGTAPTTHVSDYLGMVPRYPIDFLGIYVRHIVNGLDVRDGRAYLQSPSINRHGRSVFNFLVLAFAVWTLLAHRISKLGANPVQAPSRFWWIGLSALLLPVAAAVPGAVETRFFLPIHLLAYCVIAFRARPKELWVYLKSHPLWLLIGATFAGLYFSIVLSTLAQIN